MDYGKLKEMAKSAKGDNYSVFCSGLFACADIIKIAHLKVSGPGAYAAHVALGDLYDSLSDMADDITETIQGYKGILTISIPASSYQEPISYIKSKRAELIGMIEKMEEEMPDVSNKLQDLIGAMSKTLYKLENLK
jgi:DNA-binding ferritin-like protein